MPAGPKNRPESPDERVHRADEAFLTVTVEFLSRGIKYLSEQQWPFRKFSNVETFFEISRDFTYTKSIAWGQSSTSKSPSIPDNAVYDFSARFRVIVSPSITMPSPPDQNCCPLTGIVHTTEKHRIPQMGPRCRCTEDPHPEHVRIKDIFHTCIRHVHPYPRGGLLQVQDRFLGCLESLLLFLKGHVQLAFFGIRARRRGFC